MADAMYVQILDAVILALNTNRPSEVPQVTSRRLLPGELLEAAQMAVFLGGEDTLAPRGKGNVDPITRRTLPVAIQCAAPTETAAELDKIVQPMLIWATSVLGHSRLGGLVYYLRESGTERAVAQGDVFIMTATQIYECSYQTRRDNLTVKN